MQNFIVLLVVVCILWTMSSLFIKGQLFSKRSFKQLKKLADSYGLIYTENPVSVFDSDKEEEYLRNLFSLKAGSIRTLISFNCTLLITGNISGHKIEIANFTYFSRGLGGRNSISRAFTTRIIIDDITRYANLNYISEMDSIYGGFGYAPADFIAKVFSEVSATGKNTTLIQEGSFVQSKTLFVTTSYLCVGVKKPISAMTVGQSVIKASKSLMTPAVTKIVLIFVAIIIVGFAILLYLANQA